MKAARYSRQMEAVWNDLRFYFKYCDESMCCQWKLGGRNGLLQQDSSEKSSVRQLQKIMEDGLGVWDGNTIKFGCDDCCTTINVIKFIE